MTGGNTSFMAGVPELMILRLLRDREMYGYEIVQAIAAASGQVIALGEGVVYPVLHALEKEGALRSSRKRVNGRARVYYSLTPRGLNRYARLAQTWTTLTGAIMGMLRETRHAPV